MVENMLQVSAREGPLPTLILLLGLEIRPSVVRLEDLLWELLEPKELMIY